MDLSSLPTLAAQVQQDLEALDDNGDFLPGLVTEFKQDLGKALELVRSCHQCQDFQGFKDACHSIKSLAGHLGAMQLSELGKAGMQFDPEALENDESRSWFLQLTNAGSDAVKALDDWMDQYRESLGAGS